MSIAAENNRSFIETGCALVTCEEVAAVGRITQRAVEGACKRGSLKAAKVGRSWRIPRRAALEFLGLDADEG